jgi:hypothetical protein
VAQQRHKRLLLLLPLVLLLLLLAPTRMPCASLFSALLLLAGSRNISRS